MEEMPAIRREGAYMTDEKAFRIRDLEGRPEGRCEHGV